LQTAGQHGDTFALGVFGQIFLACLLIGSGGFFALLLVRGLALFLVGLDHRVGFLIAQLGRFAGHHVFDAAQESTGIELELVGLHLRTDVDAHDVADFGGVRVQRLVAGWLVGFLFAAGEQQAGGYRQWDQRSIHGWFLGGRSGSW
jgi:hypothetical protein